MQNNEIQYLKQLLRTANINLMDAYSANNIKQIKLIKKRIKLYEKILTKIKE